MAKKLKTYVANGTVNIAPGVHVDIDDLTVQAYSPKQAKLKVAFAIKERMNKNITVTAIYRALKRSGVRIRER